MNNLKDIHNSTECAIHNARVVILGFQWTIWRTYTTLDRLQRLFYCCYIRISMNNLKDIHNLKASGKTATYVVILGFQWTIWRTYTTYDNTQRKMLSCYIRISMNNLKDIHNTLGDISSATDVVILGFQWTIWRTYTTRQKIAFFLQIIWRFNFFVVPLHRYLVTTSHLNSTEGA